ncbi:DUF1918 domain-containing protein [Actinokineospora sp. HUAS TT18]|uniref:DUF1918 domain-containing protein n=1 Tax=Actinokineospora sp. HUAS TT18 TaxID=3447451 RepID=UPI003F5264EB
MRAAIGDRIRVHSRTVGQAERAGEIIEVRGPEGTAPFLVRFTDGHEGLVYPGPDTIIDSADHD